MYSVAISDKQRCSTVTQNKPLRTIISRLEITTLTDTFMSFS